MYASPILLYETTDPPSHPSILTKQRFEVWMLLWLLPIYSSALPLKTKTCQQRPVSYDEWDIKFHKCNKTNGNNKYQIWMKTVKIPITGVVFSVDWHLNSGLCSEPGGADVDDGLLSPGPSAGPHHLSVRAGGVVSGGTGGTAGDHEGCTSRPLINSGAKVTDPGAKRSDPGAKSTDPGTKRTDPGAKSTDLGTESTDQGTKSTESGTVPCHICDHWYRDRKYWPISLTTDTHSDKKYLPILVIITVTESTAPYLC